MHDSSRWWKEGTPARAQARGPSTPGGQGQVGRVGLGLALSSLEVVVGSEVTASP